MRKNRGFTLVELILVMACFGLVVMFFWSILGSASEDTYTINDKIAVQTSVTSLMNIIQQDIQEAKIGNIKKNGTQKGIIITIDKGGKPCYIFNTSYITDELEYNDNTIEYVFDSATGTVTRNEGTGNNMSSVYSDIISFSMDSVTGTKYGADIDIMGGKKLSSGEIDKRSEFSLSSTYYTRNTV